MVIESPEEQENIKDQNSSANDLSFKFNKWGIVEVTFDPELQEINLDHLKLIRFKLKEFGGGKKMLQFSRVPHAVTMSPEAREYIVSEESRDFTMASAVLIDSLSKKIIFNFYLRFYKHKIPVRGFSSEEDAFVWLLGFRE